MISLTPLRAFELLKDTPDQTTLLTTYQLTRIRNALAEHVRFGLRAKRQRAKRARVAR